MDETQSEERREAEQAAARILAEHGVPVGYEQAQTLLALAYLLGQKDGIVWTRKALR